MDETKKYWEERAKNYQLDVRGVLFKKPYPDFVNSWFHNWSLSQVEKIISKKENLTILDIACGWGRVSASLLKKYPKLKSRGVDISSHYVKLYNKLLSPRGKAITGTMEKLPFTTKSMDCAFLIVSLMYLPTKARQQKAVNEIFRVLKGNGKFLLIERTPLMAIFDIRKRNHKQISFTSTQIHDLIDSVEGKILNQSSWPFQFLPLYIAYFINK